MSLVRIARHLGLSVTTVSRALGGFDDVAPATRARVLAEAERISYQPNRLARGLRRGRSGAVGVVLPAAPGNFQEPFFLSFLAAIGPELAGASVDLLVMTAPQGAEEMRAYRHLVEGCRVDGVLLIRPHVEDERVTWLLAQGMPLVVHGRTGDPAGGQPLRHAWVDVDGAGAFATAVDRLVEAGHRRIALIGAPQHFFFAANRAFGWRSALAAHGLPPSPMRVAEPSEDGGYRAAHELLAGTDAPTALLCTTDRLAMGALRAIADAGLRPGHDVSVIGYDNLQLAGWVRPALTTFTQPVEEAARHMVAMLLRLIAGEDATGMGILLPARLVVRDSDGPAPAPKKNQSNGGQRERNRIHSA